MTSQDEALGDKYFSVEKYLTHIPFIAVAVALTFDVGAFYAIGIDFFTLFSLSEHIVFALEALPVVIALLLPIAIVFPGLFSRTTAQTPKRPLRKKHQYIVILVLLLLVGGLASFVAYIIYENFKADPFGTLLILFTLVGVAPAIGIYFVDPKFKQAHIFISVILACLVVSFVFGIGFGRGLFNLNTTPTILRLKSREAPVRGRVIRSGEKGTLFYDSEAKLVRFERWDAVSSIERGVEVLK